MANNSANVLSSLGLNAYSLKAFGFTGQSAVSAFGQGNVQNFVNEFFGVVLPAGSYTTDTFDFTLQANQGIQQSNGSLTSTDYVNSVNALLATNFGAGTTLDDLQYTTDANGNVTATLNGTNPTTVNIEELLQQAITQTQHQADQV